MGVAAGIASMMGGGGGGGGMPGLSSSSSATSSASSDQTVKFGNVYNAPAGPTWTTYLIIGVAAAALWFFYGRKR